MKMEIANKYYNKEKKHTGLGRQESRGSDRPMFSSFLSGGKFSQHSFNLDCRFHSTIGKFSKRHVKYLVKRVLKCIVARFKCFHPALRDKKEENVSPAVQGSVQLKTLISPNTCQFSLNHHQLHLIRVLAALVDLIHLSFISAFFSVYKRQESTRYFHNG